MSVEIEKEKSQFQSESGRTLRSLIDDFEARGAHPALISFSSRSSDTISYGALLQSIRQVAAGFAQRGLKKGESVVMFAPNSSAWVITALGVIYYGGITVPMDSQQTDEVLKHIVEDSEARFICTNKKGAERVRNVFKDKGPEIIILDNTVDKKSASAEKDQSSWKNLLDKALPESALPKLKRDDFTLLFYTSGTTGMPKGVPLTHANILLQLDSVISKTDLLRPPDRVLMPLPFFHVYPCNIGIFAPFLMGLPIILPHSLTGPEIKRAISEGKVTVVIGVPRLLRSLYQAIEAKFYKHKPIGMTFDALLYSSAFLNRYLHIKVGKFLFQPVHKQLGPTLRLFTSGGAPLEAPLAAKFKGLGFDLACGYGLTETSPLLALRMPGNSNIKSAGEAISGVELRVQPLADEDKAGRDIKEGQGEIQARGPNVFAGYRNLPDKTKEAFTEDGWFRTGDLGYFEGKELYIVGRASSTIVMEGGEKIQPDDIEDRLSKLPGISEIGLLQKDHKLVALVVPDAKSGDKANKEAIATQLKESAKGSASYLGITDFALTDAALPRTNLGKIKRFELSDLYDKAKASEKSGQGAKAAGGETSSQDKELLNDPAAQKCFDWLKSRFPDQDITFDTSPQMDLAIDSLEWMNLTFELLDQTGVELSEEAIGRVQTVRDLLTEVSNASQGGGSDSDIEGKLSPVEEPESYLNEDEKSYVQPSNPEQANKAKWLYNLTMLLMRPFRVESVGLENLPQGQFILTPNHSSYIDAFAIIAALPWVRLQKTQWAGWVGIAFGNPLFAYLSKLGQVIPIDAQHSLMTSLAMSAMALKNGKNLVWFPEGERTLDGKLLEFKAGVGMLLEKSDIPVVPVYIEGAREALPPGRYWPTFCKIRVIFGKSALSDTLAYEGSKKAEEPPLGLNEKDAKALAQGNKGDAPNAAPAKVQTSKDDQDDKNDQAAKGGQSKSKAKQQTVPEQIVRALRRRVGALADSAQASDGSDN